MADGNKAKAAPRKWATEIEHIKRSKIAPSAHNARKHPEDQVIQIADSILAFGWTIPILVDESNTIIAGEGRWLAAGLLLERGDVASDLIPCIRFDKLSEEEKRALIVADNKLTINGEWDMAKLGQELADLDALGFDLDLTGFSGDELAELLGGGGTGEGDGAGQDEARQTLAERFGFVPFTVFSAREGRWQERKAAWIALGIESELGRGAPPGGSRQPAVDPETGKIVRADSKGRAISGAKTDAEADAQGQRRNAKGAVDEAAGALGASPTYRDPAFYAKKRAWEAENGRKISTEEFREKHWDPNAPAPKSKKGAKRKAGGAGQAPG